MKAFVNTSYGPPEVLRLAEIPKPEPAANEVLIRLRASTVNRTDCGILFARPFIIRLFTGLIKPTTPVRGTDFAGIVESVGKKVTLFSPGDRVWGFDDGGLQSHAEYMVFPEHKGIARIPEGISFEQAAAAPEGAHYALNFINKVNIRPGDRVLVNGATGAIGSAMVQLLKHRGAVITAVGNTKNVAMLKSLGVQQVINYEAEDFTAIEERFPFIFDAVGKSTFAKCRPLLLPGGVYVSSELGPHNQNLYLPLTTRFFGNTRVIFPFPSDIPRTLQHLTPLLAEGKFLSVIDRTYRFEHIPEAYRYVASGQKTGNVVIVFE